MRKVIVGIFMTLLLVPWIALGQGQTTSPYQGQQTREIKALSSEDIRALTNGEGMGLAKSAELNEYPGPAHVIQLAQALDLSAEQLSAIQVVFNHMKADAVSVGTRILALERGLDQAFAQHTIDRVALEQKVSEIAKLEGELRTVHLRAHLETLPLLSMHQVHQYQVLRGYGLGDANGSPHMHSGEMQHGGVQ